MANVFSGGAEEAGPDAMNLKAVGGGGQGVVSGPFGGFDGECFWCHNGQLVSIIFLPLGYRILAGGGVFDRLRESELFCPYNSRGSTRRSFRWDWHFKLLVRPTGPWRLLYPCNILDLWFLILFRRGVSADFPKNSEEF